jgi:protein TonB
VEQTSAPVATTDSPVAEQETKTTNSKPVLSVAEGAADTQPYQSPNFNAAYLNNPAPNYPSISRRLGEQGLVLLNVQVTADGTADSVELKTSSGSTRLDEAALEAVKKWRFTPAKRGDQAVSASVVVPVRFSLEG